MAVTYLSRGESPTAEHMNQLFAELERKLAVAYDNKSFYIAAARPPTLGKTFIWRNGPQVYGPAGSTYNHSTYTTIAASAVATGINSTKKLFKTSTDITQLANSLEAHTKTGFYLMAMRTTCRRKSTGTRWRSWSMRGSVSRR
jgi:hypothetical protein